MNSDILIKARIVETFSILVMCLNELNSPFFFMFYAELWFKCILFPFFSPHRCCVLLSFSFKSTGDRYSFLLKYFIGDTSCLNIHIPYVNYILRNNPSTLFLVKIKIHIQHV